ncbi:MAG: peptidylprolyl isomerase [Bacteroidales bacterium]|nr:peptidylprolyl isomerase [Bacteroidales bacterium]
MAPDKAEHWKTHLLDCRLDTFRATVAIRRPAKADGWAGFDFGYRDWNDLEMVILHPTRFVVSRSRPDGKGKATITELRNVPLNAKAAGSLWSYFRVEGEGGQVRVSGSSDGDMFHPVYESPAADGYQPGRIGFTVRDGDHGGEFKLIRLETRDAPSTVVAQPAGKPVVLVKTSMGDFKVELYPDKAPRTVATFLKNVEDRHYDRTLVNDVWKGGRMCLGYRWVGLVSKMPPNNTKPPEKTALKNEAGTFSTMGGGTILIVNFGDNSGWSDKADCVIGRVVEGMDVVRRIEQVPVRKTQEYSNLPVEEVIVTSIRREP